MRGRRALGPGSLKKVNGTWRLQWRDAQGSVRRKMLGRDQRTAERIRADIIRARDLELAGLGDEAGQELRLSDLVPEYLAELRHRVVPRHYAGVVARLTLATDHLGDLRVREIKPASAIAVRNQVLERGGSHRTANLHASTLGALLAWAEEAERVAKNPLRRVRKLPETADHQRYRRRAMTEAEIARFLDAARQDDERCQHLANFEGWTRVPQVPLWRAMLETGARWSELRQAAWGDLDFGEAVLVLRASNTKSRRQREIPIGIELLETLRELRQLHARVHGRVPGGGDGIFLSPEGSRWGRPTNNPMRIFARVLAAAGIPKLDDRGDKLDLHAMRVTANTRLARLGVEVSTRQRLLGHSDPRLTATTYTRLGIADLAAAVRRLPPLGAPERVAAQPAAASR